MKYVSIDTQKIIQAAYNFFTDDRNLRILLVFSISGIIYGAIHAMSSYAWFFNMIIYAVAAVLLYTAIKHLHVANTKEVPPATNTQEVS